jgi:tetratricopeptide (TPR) repeat protein
MYKGRINAWKLRKNLNKDEKATMIRKMRHGKPINQTLPNRRPILHRLVRYCKENRVSPATLAMNSRDRHSTTPCNTEAHITSAPPELQSRFKPAFQPAQPIALHGSIRAVEIIIQNIDIYVNHYFAEGPGTRYYKKKLLGDTDPRSHRQAFVLVKDEQAWQGVLDPVDVVNSMRNADDAISIGFIESGFRGLGNAVDLIKTLFTQQNPELIGNLFVIFFRHFPDATNLARKIRRLFIEMASIVLGSEHPLSIVVTQLSTLSNVAEKSYVWRTLSDVLTTPFSLLEDNTPLCSTKWDCINGLTDLGALGEASDYLDMIVLAKGELEKSPTYLLSKGYLLHKQGKYLESKILHQESLENWKDHEQDILAAGKDCESMELFYVIGNCIFYLAIALEDLHEIEQAKALRRRAFDLCCKARGPDTADSQITGSLFDKFLTHHGYFEERDELRAEYPALLDRKEIPQELQSRANGLAALALASVRKRQFNSTQGA